MSTPRRILLAVITLAAALPLTVAAQTAWPDKPIRFVVPYTPGGGTDTVSLGMAPLLAA